MKFSRFFSRCTTALTLLIATLVVASDLPAQFKGMAAAKAAKNKGKPTLFKIDGVVAAGISGDEKNNAVVKVFLSKKDAKGIPAKIDGVTVVTQVVGEIFAQDDKNKSQRGKPPKNDGGSGPRDRYPRPVPIGVSVGTDTLSFCFAGTLGCRLKLVDLTTGNVVSRHMLSNNHVFAEENQGTIGVDQIIQPGTLDNNCVLDLNDVIGTLEDFVPMTFTGTNFVDAAIATANAADVGTATPAEGWGNPTSTSVSAAPGMVVQKYGRTTGLTEGVIDSVNVSVNVTYDTGTAYFENQIIIQGRRQRGKRFVASQFSDGGDSGSLIVDENRNPVGLLFAGNSSVTIANPIDAVLDSFSEPQNGLMMFVDDGN